MPKHACNPVGHTFSAYEQPSTAGDRCELLIHNLKARTGAGSMAAKMQLGVDAAERRTLGKSELPMVLR